LDQQLGSDRDAAAMIGFTPRADQIDANYRSEFGATAAENIENEALANTITEGRGLIREGIIKGAKPEETGRNLTLLLDRHIATGANKRLANRAAIGAVAEAVLVHENVNLWKILDTVRTSPGNTLKNDPTVPEIMARTNNALAGRVQARRDAEAKQLKLAQEANLAAVHQAMIDAALDPSAGPVNLQVFQRDLRELNPGAADDVPEYWRKLNDVGIQDNPRAYDAALLQLYTNPEFGRDELLRGVGDYSTREFLALDKLREARDSLTPTQWRLLDLHKGLLGGRYVHEDVRRRDQPVKWQRREWAVNTLVGDYLRYVTQEGAGKSDDEHQQWLEEHAVRIEQRIPLHEKRGIPVTVPNPAFTTPAAITPDETGWVPMQHTSYNELVSFVAQWGRLPTEDYDLMRTLNELSGAGGDESKIYAWLGLPLLAEIARRAMESAAAADSAATEPTKVSRKQ
jgi:hypothetical protein